MNKEIIVFLLLLSLSSYCISQEADSVSIPHDTTSLAEDCLGSLAQTANTWRTVGGVIELAIGIPTTVGGIIISGDTKTEGSSTVGTILIVGGLIIDGFGIWHLSTSSREEDEYLKVKRIHNVHDKDSVGYKALKLFAKKAGNSRKLQGGLSVISSLGMFIGRPLKTLESEKNSSALVEKDHALNDVFGVVFAACAVYLFFETTPAENALKEYETARINRNSFSLQIGTDSNQCIRFGFIYSF